MEWPHLHALGAVLRRTQTQELTLWDAQAYTRAIGWGLFFESWARQARPAAVSESRIDNTDGDSDNDAWFCAFVDDALRRHRGSRAGAAAADNVDYDNNNDDTSPKVIADLWHQVPFADVRWARRRIVDRFILHSPFIDLNPKLLQLVLQRTEIEGDKRNDNGDKEAAEVAKLLRERFDVDSAFAVATDIQHLLRAAVQHEPTTPQGFSPP